MNFADVLRSLFEVALVIAVLWGLFHEDRFVAFEEKLFAALRRRTFKVIRGGSVVKSTCMPTYSATEKNA